MSQSLKSTSRAHSEGRREERSDGDHEEETEKMHSWQKGERPLKSQGDLEGEPEKKKGQQKRKTEGNRDPQSRDTEVVSDRSQKYT